MSRARLFLPVSMVLAATALVGGALPMVLTTQASYAGVPAAVHVGEPAFAGYSAGSWAAPVKIEIYEPTIPIPATPQAELEVGYTTTEITTGLLKGRASHLWPGNPVGSGFVTFGEALGLPPQIYQNGYPVQVNSEHPGGPEEHRDEPFPGVMMRTSASAEKVTAVAGFSPDGQPSNEGTGSVTGSDLSDPDAFGAAITGSAAGSAPASEDGPEGGGTPGLPPELAHLVDLSGFESHSTSAPTADVVRSTASSRVGGVDLLGGLVSLEGLSATTTTTSNGQDSDAEGQSKAGSITIAGQEFAFGSDGIRAGGQKADIPGLPDDPDRALAQLGLTVTRPDVALASNGLAATGLAEAVRVEIDTATLKRQLSAVPGGDVVGSLPPNELTNLVGALANLSPRIVLTLGTAGAESETITGLDTTLPTEEPTTGADGGAKGGGGGVVDGTGGSTGAEPTAAGAPASAPTSTKGTPAPAGELEDAARAAGLPALNTIPGALTMGGIFAAIVAGTWLRRIGAMALGGASTCRQGLDSGLPDLRKA